MRSILPRRALCVLALLAIPAVPAGAVITLPPNFVVEDVAPGAGLNTPVGVAFLPGGRMLVAEKRGRVYAIMNGVKNPTPMWSRENEVLNNNDRGLLGIAVDPHYVTNHYIYLLYTVDPDSNGDDSNDDAFARLTRYTVSFTDSNVVDNNSRTVLFGTSWSTGIVSCSPSHTIGSLRWGRDGSLLVSAGDGAQFNSMDKGGQDPGAFGAGKTAPFEDIGAFRSQDLGSLNGKILRLNPATGLGYSTNPYYDGNLASIRSRVWVYGLRNPFRFCVRPGTGDTLIASGNPGALYIGDVGWDTYEECDVAPNGGINFGWPCYEGFQPQAQYQAAKPSHGGCDSIGTFLDPTPAFNPLMSWNHTYDGLSVPPGFHGNTSIGGAFYTATRYPAQYRGAYFLGDYGQNWIKVATVDAGNNLISLATFADSTDGPVDFAIEPGTGNLIYVSILTGEVRRIRYTGSLTNAPPVAFASAAPTAGVRPLTVNFSSAGTYDPDGDPITYNWLFGDGQGSTNPNPSHTYATAGIFSAVLSVTDTSGAIGRDTVRVIVAATGGFPTTGVLDNFNRANGPISGLWVDNTAGLFISGNALTQTIGSASTVWNGAVFGPDQEAFVTLAAVTLGAPEHDLMLKVQGLTWSSGYIEVRYDDGASAVTISTYDATHFWQSWATISPITFAAGDQFGGRALSNGVVEVYKNGVKVGGATIDNWPYTANGGHLGLVLTDAISSRLDDFGGGNVGIVSNTKPTAGITTPLDHSFFATGDTIRMTGTGIDAQDPPAALIHRWEADLHHNTHIHPSVFVSDSASTYMLGVNHDDGTGVYFAIRHIVTDTGALSDTARVNIYPEIDLTPSALKTQPSTPGTTAPATFTFHIRNLGRMPAPISRWRLIAGGTMLAEGDTLVPALDSVAVTRVLAPTLSAGSYTLRVVADTLAAVVETNENNNALARPLTVVVGPGPDETPPLFTLGPVETPSGVMASVRWRTNEPTSGAVRYGPTPALGDSATVPRDTSHVATLTGLTLGVKYYCVVAATDTAGNTTVAAIDSFVTQSGPLAADPIPTRFALSNAFPNPSGGAIAFALDLPHAARVEFSVHDVLGREVWRDPRCAFDAGRWSLKWSGISARGARARSGFYLARVVVDGRAYVRRAAVLN